MIKYDVLQNEFACKLIGRNTSVVYSNEAKELIKGKTILVTGGAGSIGSEVLRQCVKLGAKRVYALDNDEFALYRLSLELLDTALLREDIFILADITDRLQIVDVFNEVKPEIVIHYAVKKHLPLLERSSVSAIKTNLNGTDTVFDTCLRFKVQTAINVSTDKAANPIIDKRVTRYLTIPEATSLIIESAVLANNGETYLLEKGEPILLMDIIRRYVELSGLKYPDIVFTGLRVGEKLPEELNNSFETSLSAGHPKISKINATGTILDSDLVNLNLMLQVNDKPEKIIVRLQYLLKEIESRHTAAQGIEKTQMVKVGADLV